MQGKYAPHATEAEPDLKVLRPVSGQASRSQADGDQDVTVFYSLCFLENMAHAFLKRVKIMLPNTAV